MILAKAQKKRRVIKKASITIELIHIVMNRMLLEIWLLKVLLVIMVSDGNEEHVVRNWTTGNLVKKWQKACLKCLLLLGGK